LLKNNDYRILVTGSGGIGGVNFISALRIANYNYHITGTDFNRFYLEFPQVDSKYITPKHSNRLKNTTFPHLVGEFFFNQLNQNFILSLLQLFTSTQDTPRATV